MRTPNVLAMRWLLVPAAVAAKAYGTQTDSNLQGTQDSHSGEQTRHLTELQRRQDNSTAHAWCQAVNAHPTRLDMR